MELNVPVVIGIVLVLAIALLAFAAWRVRERARRKREEIAIADAQPRVSARLDRMRRTGGPLDATTITEPGAEPLTMDAVEAAVTYGDAADAPGRAAATTYEEPEIEEVSLERLRSSTAAPLRRGAPPVAWRSDSELEDAPLVDEDAPVSTVGAPDAAGYEEAERTAALTSEEADAIQARLAAMRGTAPSAATDADAASPSAGSAPRARPRDPYAGYEDPFPEEELPAFSLLANVEEPPRVAEDPQLASATTRGPAAAPLEPLPKPVLGDAEEVEGQPFYGVEARVGSPAEPTPEVEEPTPEAVTVEEVPVLVPEAPDARDEPARERGRRRDRRVRPEREGTADRSRLRRGRRDRDEEDARAARAPSPERARAQLRRDASVAVLLFALVAGLAFTGGVARAAPPAAPSASPAAASPAR